jgi:chromate transport protein ChrA
VLAIVLVAAWRVGRRALHTPMLLGIATAAFLALAVVRLPYPLVVAGAAITGLMAGRWRPGLLFAPARVTPQPTRQGGNGPSPSSAQSASIGATTPIHGDDTPTPPHCRFSRRRLALTLLAWGLGVLIPLALLGALGGWNGTLALMARFFTRVALLSFGGAYAVLPYVAQGAVEQFDWLSATQMLDGLALEPVVDPAALLAVGEQARLLQHLEMKRELRLGQAQLGREVADAALAAAQHLQHLQAQGIGEGLEPLPGQLGGDGVIQNTHAIKFN